MRCRVQSYVLNCDSNQHTSSESLLRYPPLPHSCSTSSLVRVTNFPFKLSAENIMCTVGSTVGVARDAFNARNVANILRSCSMD